MTTYYFDHNASTFPYEEVIAAMNEWSLPNKWANPSAKHHAGKLAAKAVQEARVQIATLIEANSEEEIFFCSGATEAINLGLQGMAQLLAESNTPTRIAGFADEHPAVGSCLSAMQKRYHQHPDIEIVPSIESSFTGKFSNENPRLLLLVRMLAQNETGQVYDLPQIRSQFLREEDWLFSDLSQAVGKIPVSVQQLNIQMGAFSGHKLGGPAGIGVLYMSRKKPRLSINPLTFGGGQEQGLRPGSLNLPGIVGLGVAAQLVKSNLDTHIKQLESIRRAFETKLRILVPEVQFLAEQHQRLPNTSMVILPAEYADTMKHRLPGLCVTQGSACASASGKSSHVLAALGLKKEQIARTYRFSFGRNNSIEEVTSCLEVAFRGISH